VSAVEELAKATYEAWHELAPLYGVEVRDTPWSDLPQVQRAALFGVATRLLDRHLQQLAALYGVEVGRAASDGVCGDTLADPTGQTYPAAWVGACVLRPEDLGMHENANKVRWTRRPDGQVVVDGSDATHSHVIGVGP
jgi:acyl-CoA reductase-like NAD-dependent aldehyde dehydrogenase